MMLTKEELAKKFTKILDEKEIIFSQDKLQFYKQNTLGFDDSFCNEYIAGVFKPTNVEQVQAIVELANLYNMPLYPISTGRNWGYGSKIPTARGSYIIDLSGMNKIREVNQEVGYAVIEPGVTQEDLTIYLKENASHFIMDKTGTPAATSIIGNVLERGFGLRACRDNLVNGLEIIPGSGKLFRTGSWGVTGKPFYRYTPGPLVDQFFCESNFGIITAMSLKLYPRPEQMNAIFCTIPRENLSTVLNEIREIKKHDLNTFFKVFFTREYIVSKDTPFMVLIFMYGEKALLELRTKKISSIFNKLGKVNIKSNISSKSQENSPEDLVSNFLHPDSTREADISNYMFRDFSEVSIPNHENLDQVEDFGLCFYDCIIPNEQNAANEVLQYLTDVIDKKYKLSRRTTLHAYDHETLVVVNYIVFNRKDKDAFNRSRKCVDELYSQKYFLPIRLTPWHMNYPYEGREFLNGLKHVFDPKQIISPGRYI